MNTHKHVCTSLSSVRRAGRIACILATALAMGAAATAASASTVLKLNLQSLVANSEQIVDGGVTRVHSQVEDGKVYTYTTVDVREAMKGASDGQTLTIKQVGGRTDDLATWVPGVPQFTTGERVIVFLEKPSPDTPAVVTGMSQGKFRVAVGPDNITPYVVPQLGDIGLLAPQNQPATADQPADSAGQAAVDAQTPPPAAYQTSQPDELYKQVVPLTVFKQRVREAIRAQGG